MYFLNVCFPFHSTHSSRIRMYRGCEQSPEVSEESTFISCLAVTVIVYICLVYRYKLLQQKKWLTVIIIDKRDSFSFFLLINCLDLSMGLLSNLLTLTVGLLERKIFSALEDTAYFLYIYGHSVSPVCRWCRRYCATPTPGCLSRSQSPELHVLLKAGSSNLPLGSRYWPQKRLCRSSLLISAVLHYFN